MKFSTETEALNLAKELFNKGKFEELCKFSQDALEVFPRAKEIWKIFGAALGNLGRSSEARRAFLAALKIDSSDGFAVANYITSCFHSGDVRSAATAIEIYYDELPDEIQSMILQSISESIQSRIVKKEDLPPVIQELMNASDEEEQDNLERAYILTKKEKTRFQRKFEKMHKSISKGEKLLSQKKFTGLQMDRILEELEKSMIEIVQLLK